MKRSFTISRGFTVIIALSIILTFVLAISAQKKRVKSLMPSFAEDTAINPHDFNDAFYLENGVNPKMIINRRSGTDFLSVLSISSNPIHRNVRVLATLPAYDPNNAIYYWFPLGEINENAFTEDAAGAEAREIANYNLMYVFPKKDYQYPFSFNNNRQAAIIDDSNSYIYPKGNPLGLRLVVLVNYTEKAFNTKEGYEMMVYMSKKNGLSLDGTPLLKNAYEIEELAKEGFLSMTKEGFRDDAPYGGNYAIAPVLQNVVKGVIAPDAFLITVMKDGRPLPDEMIFKQQFDCLQKNGDWCFE